MAKAKKVAKALAKVAPRKPAKAEPKYPGPAPGSIVWIRWDVGQYKIGVLTKYTRDDKPVCRVARVDRNGAYTGDEFGTERTFEPGEVSRVFHERDWDAIGNGESVGDVDARMARGPKVDDKGRVRDDQPKIGGRNVIDVDDVDSAFDVAQLILDDKAISAGTLRNLARWTLHANNLLEEWKAKCQQLEADRDLDDEDKDDKRDARELPVRGNTEMPQMRARKGDIVSIRYGKEWEPAVVAFIDANEMIFDTVDGNSGSRDVAAEGKAWVLAPDNIPGVHRGKQVDNLARAAFEDYRIEHESRKRKGTAAKMPSTDETASATPDERIENRRRGAAKVVERDGLPPLDQIAPHIRGNAYCMTHCGPECRLYQGPEFRDPPVSDDIPVINVKVGRKWEGVHVDRVTSEIVGFIGGDGTKGTRPWSTFGRDWNIPSLGTWDTKAPIKLRVERVEAVHNAHGHNPLLAELHRQLMLEAIDVDATAQGAERERKKVQRQSKRALRAATGTSEPSPVDRAVASGKSDKCGARGPDGITCVIDAGHGASTPVGKAIQHSNGPRTWTEALPKMVVTKEVVGPPIEQSFIEDISGSMTGTRVLVKIEGNWIGAVVAGNDNEQMMCSYRLRDLNQTVMVKIADEGKRWRRDTPAPATVSTPPAEPPTMTLHQRNMAEAKRRGVPVWQIVEEQEKAASAQRAAEATASVRHAVERDANETADDDELSVASDRELQALGKKREPDGRIVDDAPSWPTPEWAAEKARNAPMPWDDAASDAQEGAMPWD